eukprot:scaffold200089_cov20-Tisochrysis_lutea.AAC.2
MEIALTHLLPLLILTWLRTGRGKASPLFTNLNLSGGGSWTSAHNARVQAARAEVQAMGRPLSGFETEVPLSCRLCLCVCMQCGVRAMQPAPAIHCFSIFLRQYAARPALDAHETMYQGKGCKPHSSWRPQTPVPSPLKSPCSV